MGIQGMTFKYRIPLLSAVPVVLGLVLLATLSSSLFQSPSLLILNEVMLFSSLFVPGYLIQSVLIRKLTSITLSNEERIACSFGLSLFLISGISFITTLTGSGLREIFYAYFLVSSVLLAIVIMLNRKWILRGISTLKKWPTYSSNNLLFFTLLFLAIPLFHFFGFAKLNWDGFTFYLRDGLAISISNSVSAYYPESFYEGNIPLVFNSYLSSVTYSYGLNVLNIGAFEGNPAQLMEYTNIALSFLVLATLFATCLLLRSFAHRVFKDKYLAASTVIIFLTTPLLNQFLYVWSLYADLFFAFETLLVFAFAYIFLKDRGKDSRYFSLLMIGIGLSLATVTKTYGYLLLLVIPIICLGGIRRPNHTHLDHRASPPRMLPELEQRASPPAYEARTVETAYALRKDPQHSSHNPPKILVFALFAIIIGFASLYAIRGIVLTGSPFGYTVQTLVNYSENEFWANEILDSSGIHESVENYPTLNQTTSLLLSYGLFPLLTIPLLIGIIYAIKKSPRGIGLIAIYVLCYYVTFVTILELRADRHLFSLITLLPILYVVGLRTFGGYLRWKRKGILYATLILSALQLPLLDAIYNDFHIAEMFPSMYYWYTNNNLVSLLSYSFLTFGVAIALTHAIVNLTSKRNIEPYIFGTLFGLIVLVIIGSAATNVFAKYDTYEDYIHRSYEDNHLGYPAALQDFLRIDASGSGNRLLYLHGLGTEYLTMAHASYLKIDDFRMLADMRGVIEEKDPDKVHESLMSKNIKYILYPSEHNPHYRKLLALSNVTDRALIFSDPSSVTTKKIQLNYWWDLYVV